MTKMNTYIHCRNDLPFSDEIILKIQKNMDDIFASFSANILLSVGDIAQLFPIHSVNIKKQFLLGTHAGDISSDLLLLPIKKRTIDICFLPFTLDYIDDSYQLIREIDRVLMHDGYVVLLCCNPFSLLFFRYFLRTKNKLFPCNYGLYTPFRLLDWFQLLGYELFTMKSITYQTLFFNDEFVDHIYDWLLRILPYNGSIYTLVMQKKSIPMTLKREGLSRYYSFKNKKQVFNS